MKKNKGVGFEFSDGRIVRKKETGQPSSEIKQGFFESLAEEEDDDNVSAFENAKSNFETRKTRERIKRISFVSFIALIVIVCFVIFGFSLRDVSVSGSVVYSNENIKATAENISGKNVLLLNTDKLEEAILAEYPALKEVSVKKKLPGSISVSVTDEQPLYHISFDSEYYLLSSDLRVMEKTNDVMRTDGVMEIQMSDVKKVRVGDVIEFYNEYQYGYMKDLLEQIRIHEVGANVVSVDASDKFDITLEYGERFTVKLGVGENIPTKLTLAKAYIESLPENETGIIDSSSTEKGSYISTLMQNG